MVNTAGQWLSQSRRARGAVCRFTWKPGMNTKPEPTIIACHCLSNLTPWPVRSRVRGEKELSPTHISSLHLVSSTAKAQEEPYPTLPKTPAICCSLQQLFGKVKCRCLHHDAGGQRHRCFQPRAPQGREMAGGSSIDGMCQQQVQAHLSLVLWECHTPIPITATLLWSYNTGRLQLVAFRT